MTGRDAEYGSVTRRDERFEPWVVHEMKFANEHVDRVLSGEKTLTARLADEWASLCGNDGLDLLNEDGEKFGTAEVLRARTFDVKQAYHVVNYHSGHHTYPSVEHFAEDLASYYPDETILPGTELRLVHFKVIDE